MDTVWITGASSGIGRALALAYSARGFRVILSSRRVAELEKVKLSCANTNNTFIVPLDLTDVSSINEAHKTISTNIGSVDILILNGGISQRSLIRETPIEIDRKIMETDYFGAIATTKAVLASMLERKKGHIVVLSSIVGIFGFPQRSAYSAAKHALHGFFETLRAEEEGNGIKVTIVCPGRILTEVSLHALTKEGSEYGIMDHAQKGGITAEVCASKIIRAVEKNKKEIYICRKEILMIYFKRYIPAMYYVLVGKVNPN